jgi:hypothetical protein
VTDDMDPNKLPAPTPARAASEGFHDSLKGVSLWDLVQLECLRGATTTFRVTQGTSTGFLYLDRGQILHARVGERVGEEAALLILSWQGGRFEPVTASQPEACTVSSSWQSLLLRAAQAQDEAQRERVRPPRPTQRLELVTSETASTSQKDPQPMGPDSILRKKSDIIPKPGAPSVPLKALRLGPGGVVLARHGDSVELEEVASYAMRLAELIGESLGLDQPERVDATLCAVKVRLLNGAAGDLLAACAPKTVALEDLDLEQQL